MDDEVDAAAAGRACRGRAPGVGAARWPSCCTAEGLQPAGQRQDHARARSIPTATPSSATSTTRPRATSPPAQPVISVDTKKKELVGEFKNGGREWRPRGEPERVDVHDFIDPELGKAIPYGVYDLAAERRLGQRRHRPRHRRVRGRHHPPLVAAGRASPPTRDATRLLITADAGGSNGYRTRLWKTELAAPRRRDRADDHRLPPAARHQQVEQDRAPAVLPHHHELARQAPDQPRSHRQHHRRDHHPHRADRRTPNSTPTPTPPASRSPTPRSPPCRMHPRTAFHGDWNYTLTPNRSDPP